MRTPRKGCTPGAPGCECRKSVLELAASGSKVEGCGAARPALEGFIQDAARWEPVPCEERLALEVECGWL